MFAIIAFDNENHRDNEKTVVHAPFATLDDAHRWASNNVKFYHLVPLRQSGSHANGGLRISTRTEREAVTS